MPCYKRYRTETLEKMLEKAIEKDYKLTTNQSGSQWGYGMRHTRLPSLNEWKENKEKIELLRKEIETRKQTER